MRKLNQKHDTRRVIFEKNTDSIRRKRGKKFPFFLYILCFCSFRENSFRESIEAFCHKTYVFDYNRIC